jgi:hypothetical protein
MPRSSQSNVQKKATTVLQWKEEAAYAKSTGIRQPKFAGNNRNGFWQGQNA